MALRVAARKPPRAAAVGLCATNRATRRARRALGVHQTKEKN
ncbi:hypothetical protein [Sphingomonas sp. LT1P40]